MWARMCVFLARDSMVVSCVNIRSDHVSRVSFQNVAGVAYCQAIHVTPACSLLPLILSYRSSHQNPAPFVQGQAPRVQAA